MSHRNRKVAALAVLGVLVLAGSALAGDLVKPRVDATSVEWQPVQSEVGLVLTVSGPRAFYLRQEFAPGQSASFSVFGTGGGLRPSGSYVYELRAVPQIDEATRAELQAARENGTEPNVLGKAGSRALEVQSGAFAIAGGRILMGGEQEPGAGKPAGSGGSRIAPKDQVIPDDLIVQGSICAGFDCVNNESFGFDTIRMKENNTRIDFTDTSAGSFPSQDWEIAANDSASGGRNALIVSDENTQLFVIESGNVANALYVDDTARIGLRTSTPVLDLHIATSNTPGIRLEQTSAGGFTAQTWDIAGNEANFFVRDVTGGSRLPFRIRPQAPTSSIDISADGDVGIGTASPDSSLHVFRSNGTAQVFVEETNGTSAARTLFNLENNGQVRFRMKDTAQTPEWLFTASNAFQIDNLADAGVEFQINPDGAIIQNGSQIHAPDYVFEPDYELMSLADLKAFVAENKHLPNVPSAEDIKRDGLNLTHMPLRLLEKVEELALYTLEQEEQITDLQEENSELKSRLEVLEARLPAPETTSGH
jgi:hypothetical protein